MKKIIIMLFSFAILSSCDSDKRVLIEGVTFVELNVRASPDASMDNVVDELDPGDIVKIVQFKEGYDREGISWCQIRLNFPEPYDGKELKYAWVAYKVKGLPFVVSEDSWNKIQRMYEMEYEKEVNEILTGAKTWVTQAIYDYVYNDYMRDIGYEFELRGPKSESNDPRDQYEVESPSHSVDFTSENRYKQYCRSRITTASIDREETALYAVIFNQSPRNIHFFRQDDNNKRGSFVKEFNFSNSLSSNIKSIDRKTSKSKVYVEDYYGYKTRLELSYDAIRIRPQKGRERYIIYNNSGYTNDNLSGGYLSLVKEY